MKVTMMLADHAQVSDGKLFISGGGWSLASPGPVSCGVALLFGVPWDRTNTRTEFVLRLMDADGHQVSRPSPQGAAPVEISGQFEVGRPPGIKAGSDINLPFAFNLVVPLAPGQRYAWVLEVDGERDDAWRLSFATADRPGAAPAG